MTDKLVAEDLSKFFDLIGPVGMVLVALFILSVLIILSKLFMFAQRRLSRTRSANEYLRRLGENEPEAIEVLENSSAPLARLLLVGARLAQTETPLIRIEADMRDAATSYLQRLTRANRTLELIGIIAPLLGLLGTVFGMIDVFRVWEASGAQAAPAALANGVMEALTTTALGLIVAIPAIVTFNLAEARIENFRQQVSVFLRRFLAAVETARNRL